MWMLWLLHPFMKQGCNIVNKKVLAKSLVNGPFGISTSAWNFCISYPESSIFCRRDTRPPYIFCGTCIPVPWRASVVSDVQGVTSARSGSTELSSLCLTVGSHYLFHTWQCTYANATLPIHPASLLPPPSSFTHPFSMSVFLFLPCKCSPLIFNMTVGIINFTPEVLNSHHGGKLVS